MKDFIKKQLREALINEDYDSQKEMEKLASEVLKNICRKLIQEVIRTKMAIRIPPFINIFEGLSSKFNILNKFLQDYKLNLYLEKITNKGEFMGGNNVKMGSITLKYDSSLLKRYILDKVLPELHDDLSTDEVTELMRDMYFFIYNSELYSTLLHELQHTYDSYRSGNKYNSDAASTNYYKKYGGKDFDQEKHDRYIKLHHEINARFSQAINDIQMTNYNYDDSNDLDLARETMVNLNDFMNEFMKTFSGYSKMTPKIQKYLLRRASQYYHKAEENLKNDN